MSHISAKFGQFKYYDLQLDHPDWKNCDVLDFGGNAGNILKHADGAIDHRKYWSLDVSVDSIAQGQREYPEAHWVFYNRYNLCFNPAGVRGMPIPLACESFDLILANSVFTHIAPKEMFSLVDHLLALLRVGGRLAFSFIEPNYWSWPGEYDGNNFKWRLDRINSLGGRINVQAYLERVKNAKWFILVDDLDLYIETEQLKPYPSIYGTGFHVYHTAEFMRRAYPEAEIRVPANREMQHCCILTKRKL